MGCMEDGGLSGRMRLLGGDGAIDGVEAALH
jgi:hypothetical protein